MKTRRLLVRPGGNSRSIVPFTAALGLTLLTVLAAGATESDDIRSVLRAQAEMWNGGDIDGFMQGYWRSDRLRFASCDWTRLGWEATRKYYNEKYPNRSAMGTLALSDIEVDQLSADLAYVFLHWSLRSQSEHHGVASLLFRKMPDGWKIIVDHTSGAGGC